MAAAMNVAGLGSGQFTLREFHDLQEKARFPTGISVIIVPDIDQLYGYCVLPCGHAFEITDER